MSIIKRADVDGIVGLHALKLAPRRPVAVPAPTPDPRDAEIEALEAEAAALRAGLAARDEALAGVEDALAQARAEGEVQGRAAGLKDAQTREAERLALLETGVARAVDAWSGTLAGLDALALLVARESLDKILGDADAYPELLARILRRQLSGIEARSVVAVQVSATDFPDAEALAALAAGAGRPGLRIEADQTLAGGDCRIELTLGGIDLGIRQQWRDLGGLLRAMADAESPA